MLQAATQGNQQLAQLPGLLIGNVDDVARQGFEACVKGEVIGVPGVVNQAPCRPRAARPDGCCIASAAFWRAWQVESNPL